MALLNNFDPRNSGMGSFASSPLTSGVDYFGNVGRRNLRKLPTTSTRTPATSEELRPENNVNRAAPSLPSASNSSVDSGFTAVPGAPGLDPATGGLVAGGLSVLGTLTQDPMTQFAGGTLGNAVAASQGQFGPLAGQTVAMLGATPLGATATALGVDAATGKGLFGGGADAFTFGNTALNATVPGYGVANFGLQAATSPAFGGDMTVSMADIGRNADVASQIGYGTYGPVDATQAAMQIGRSSVPAESLAAFQSGDFSGPGPANAGAALAMAAATNENQTTNGFTVTPSGSFQYSGEPGSGSNVSPGAVAAANQSSDPIGSLSASQGWSGGGSPTASTPSDGGGSSGAFSGGFGPDGGGSASGNSGSAGPGGVGADGSPGDGVGNGTGGWADGGMIGYDTPGLTKRYADGGITGAMPQMQMQMGGQPDAQNIQAQVAQTMRDPQRMRQLLTRPQALMQSGELTPDEVVTMGRVAEAAMFNPSLYPQLRQFVAQQGMTPLPASFDPSVIVSIIVIARALQQGQGATPAGQIPPTSQAQMENPVGMANGGYLRGPGTGRSDSIGTQNVSTGEPVKVANGEYVIPAHVVRAKGRDFFDGLLRKYTNVPKGE